MTSARGARCAILILAILPTCHFIMQPATATDPPIFEPAGSGESACGVQSLYLLARLSGLDLTLDRVDGALGPMPPAGHSLAQLIRAGHVCGLTMRGVRLNREDGAPERPAILHLARGKLGHFVVIRRVGHTGRLIQVFDPAGAVEVLDWDRLAKMPEWTGAALVIESNRGGSVGWAAILGVLVAGGVIILATARARRWRVPLR